VIVKNVAKRNVNVKNVAKRTVIKWIVVETDVMGVMDAKGERDREDPKGPRAMIVAGRVFL